MNTKIQTTYQIPTDGTFRANALQQMDILLKLEAAVAGNESVIALGIKTSLGNNTPASVIIRNLKEMATDNFDMIAGMLGNSLTNKIMDHE